MSAHPFWIYMPPSEGGFPFIAAIKLPTGQIRTALFKTKEEAVLFAEEESQKPMPDRLDKSKDM
jgi:hypothetical protein